MVRVANLKRDDTQWERGVLVRSASHVGLSTRLNSGRGRNHRLANVPHIQSGCPLRLLSFGDDAAS